MKRRLPTGTYKRGKSWYWRASVGGRRVAKGGFLSQETARQALAEFRAARGMPARGPQGALGFTTAARQYLHQVVASHVNPRGERHALGLMMDRWGERPLGTITTQDVETFKTWRAGQQRLKRDPKAVRESGSAPRVSGTTVNRDLNTLSAFYGWAQERGYVRVGVNPARAKSRHRRGVGVERFAEPWRPWQSLPWSQQAAFLGAFLPEDRPKVELLLELGVRLSVILDLEWPQIDLTTGLLHYTQKRRSVVRPLTPRALEILAGLGPQASGRLFVARSDRRIRKFWPQAVAAVGLAPGFRRHDLRVSFARRAADEGTDFRTIADLLGHSSIAMTARYVPSSLQAQRAAVLRMATAEATRRAQDSNNAGQSHGPL